MYLLLLIRYFFVLILFKSWYNLLTKANIFLHKVYKYISVLHNHFYSFCQFIPLDKIR